MTNTDVKKREEGRGKSIGDYVPLIVVVVLSVLAASAKYFSDFEPGLTLWMHNFMGFFLVIFSMFKLFDMEGFADGFQMYDLLAQKVRAYGYIYPFIELTLGLGYLSGLVPNVIYIATIIVMLFGSLGVIRALIKGLDLECACMGTILKVPLSHVTLVEDIGMAAMAAIMLTL